MAWYPRRREQQQPGRALVVIGIGVEPPLAVWPKVSRSLSDEQSGFRVISDTRDIGIATRVVLLLIPEWEVGDGRSKWLGRKNA